MRLTRRVATALVLLTVGISLAAWAQIDSTRTDSTRSAPAGDPLIGKKLFVAKKCATCHKADGSGGVRLSGNPTPNWRDAKRLSDPKYGDAYLRECLTNGRPKSGMPSWGKSKLLKPVEIGHLIAYIHTFAVRAPNK